MKPGLKHTPWSGYDSAMACSALRLPWKYPDSTNPAPRKRQPPDQHCWLDTHMMHTIQTEIWQRCGTLAALNKFEAEKSATSTSITQSGLLHRLEHSGWLCCMQTMELPAQLFHLSMEAHCGLGKFAHTSASGAGMLYLGSCSRGQK